MQRKMRRTHQAHNNKNNLTSSNESLISSILLVLLETSSHNSCFLEHQQHRYTEQHQTHIQEIKRTSIWDKRVKDKSSIMKYKKGSMVEVLTKENFCHHSWRCAKILSKNSHNYTVTYDIYPGFTNKEDIEQISMKSIRPYPPLLELPESCVPGYVVEVFHNLSWKMAIVLKAFNWDQFVVRLVGSSHELKVTKSELRVPQSFQNGEWIVIDKFKTLINLNSYKDKVLTYKEDVVSNDSVMSSSDSCSINSYNGSDCFEDIERRDSDAESVCEMEDDDDDDDDGCVSLEDEIHRLELNAYRCTMEALHASGPLTWEKETMVTNLRMLLHISNDEHLIQIKNLISSASSNTCNR
ncbi:uncharacterized protein LOC111883923 isoform X1 [Lactuca sativa]|uniref:uncharacterized protein LOC111883923 isoform X1 n=1 Tax=Lactuca sativa TaxID=4236 RepID=UPI000CD87BF5|nr:uncharacterized protein LOC111883923 isoform X1 [Lactuca sativa]